MEQFSLATILYCKHVHLLKPATVKYIITLQNNTLIFISCQLILFIASRIGPQWIVQQSKVLSQPQWNLKPCGLQCTDSLYNARTYTITYLCLCSSFAFLKADLEADMAIATHVHAATSTLCTALRIKFIF